MTLTIIASHCATVPLGPHFGLLTGAGDSDDFFKHWVTGFTKDESSFVKPGSEQSAAHRNKRISVSGKKPKKDCKTVSCK